MRKYFICNHTSDSLYIAELNVSIPPGIHNLFDLDNNLTFGQIGNSTKNGTLSAAMDNGLCSYIHDFSQQKSFSDEITLRKPLPIQAFQSRTRFITIQNEPVETVFTDDVDMDLFDDEVIKPARLIEEELKNSEQNVEEITATIKNAEIVEKPFNNKYSPPQVQKETNQEKIKNDISMGWVTCEGLTADGKRCLRQAKKNKKYCGLHIK